MLDEVRSMYNRNFAITLLRRMPKEQVTVANVMKELRLRGRGGSTETVSSLVKDFKAGLIEDTEAEGADADTLPGNDAKLADSTLLGSPRTRNDDNARTAELWKANDLLRDEVARLVRDTEASAEKLARLEERIQELEEDDERLLDRVRDAHRRRTRDFWDRVMSSVSEILKVHDRMTAHDVLEMLPSDLFEEAERIVVPLNIRTLTDRMSVPADLNALRDLEEDAA